ncbi:MAG: PAS domain S-box protein [Oscillatoriales cyanobacterium]|uniref:Adenylate/guanylate cyclase domain-containing protein n=1 Tax=Microcoleus anatoxicus PTRS2 TaxID=2705321 RepID=A0ABU8YLE9_9CYAN|nr:MAG: PAS domain S-box protein [Oscillatoriales cyanobacterium]TAD97735.1 MAG: PAS domain S-box protein [Oscillatoriales cyanobacterium]TAE05320.1 MAG: PAS domain S-box protein [Oscillatoriales cyanobacterium]TAF03795.1 MAG: PAS domain S-box protein [Oscillatoriales cyanobacterium]TAF38010.1 MAG: PAS domain S-box protein [Oscillatoriales cyanobacterium]
MKTLLQKLLVPHHLEYLALDRDFLIQETSANVQRFAYCDEIVSGNDVRLHFPELVGTEEILIDIFEGLLPNFDLKAMTRVLEDNSRLYFDMYIVEFRNDESHQRLIIFFEDVTDRMGLEQTLVQATNEMNILLSTLAATNNYVEKIITSMAEVLLVTTASGKIKKVNQAAQNLFGYSDSELVGRQINAIAPIGQSLQDLSRQGELVQTEAEVICTAKTGEKLTLAFSCTPIPSDIKSISDGGTDFKDFLYIGRDVTERKRASKRKVAQYVTTRILSASETIKKAIAAILPVICDSLGWDTAELWMPEIGEKLLSVTKRKVPISDPNLLRCVANWTKRSISIREFVEVAEQTTFAMGEGLPGRVWATGSPELIRDITENDKFYRREIAGRSGLHGAFCFPIFGDYEQENSTRSILGVIAFFSCEVQCYDEELLQTMATIGSQIGQFIKRKQAEAALRESEEQLRDLFENASDLIQSIGADGHFLYVNRAWRETLGYSEAEIAKMTVFDIIHPNSSPDSLHIFVRAIRDKEIDENTFYPDSVEAIFVTKKYQQILLEGSISCKFADGQLVAIRAILRDITDRKQAEDALAQSVSLLQATFDSTADGILAIDRTGKIVSFNREFIEMWGIPEEVMALRSDAQIVAFVLNQLKDPQAFQERIESLYEQPEAESYDLLEFQDGRFFERYSEPQRLGDEIIGRVWSYHDITERKQAEDALREEQEKSEKLLLNILPKAIAERLKRNETTIAEYFPEVTVLFADIVGFTHLSTLMNPIDLVELLNQIFSSFDLICERLGLEKIKTIGDAYMVVGGLPEPRADHAEAIAQMALDMQTEIARFNAQNNKYFSIRIGIHSGPVVAGVIGIKKFIYDLWGDTVNIASRMESHGLPWRIQVSEATYNLLQHKYLFDRRETIHVKGKGEMTTYLLIGEK